METKDFSALEPTRVSHDDVETRLADLRKRLETLGLLDSDSSPRATREAGYRITNPMDGFAPMVSSVPRADR